MKNFEEILDECLVDRGAVVEYPKLANELEPLLEVARVVQDAEHPETDTPFSQSKLHHLLEVGVEKLPVSEELAA